MGLYDRDYMRPSLDKVEAWEEEQFSKRKKKTWVIAVIVLLVVAFLLPEILYLLSQIE